MHNLVNVRQDFFVLTIAFAFLPAPASVAQG